MARRFHTHLMFVGDQHGRAEEAMNLYVSLFENSRILEVERYGPNEEEREGTLKRATLSLAGREFGASDSGREHPFTFTPSMSIFVDCESSAELERVFAALSENGEVLDYVGRRWAEQGAPVLVVIAARPEEPEAGSAFERWLLALGRGLPLRSMTLGTLTDEEIEGLLTRLATRASSSKPPAGPLEETRGSNEVELGLKQLGERLAAETDGQPFYLVETLKVLLEEGMLLIRSRADGDRVVEVGPAWRSQKSALRGLLPQSVREVIRARLSRLSAEASELVRAGAVLERGFDFESVVGVAGLGEAEGLRGLDEIIERHLVQEEASGREEEEKPLLHPSATYLFTHEKIRQVAYTEMGHARRRLSHRRAFEVLEEGGAPAAQLARHALLGGLAEQAFQYGVAAGDGAVEVFSVKDAIEHYERARDLLTEVRPGSRQLIEPSVPDLEHLYIQLGRAYELTQRWGKAREAYEAMLALGREAGEARLEVIALNNLAILSFPSKTPTPRGPRRSWRRLDGWPRRQASKRRW